MENDEEILKAADVAAWLKVSKGWVLDHTTRYAPILPHRKFGSTVRYVRGEIRQFIADSKKTTAERLEAA